MSEVPPDLVDVGVAFTPGYHPVLTVDDWRVAVLRHADGLAPEAFHRVERHRNTHEVFILTAGQADMVVCAGDAVPTTPHVFSMTLNVAYNIRRSVWHHSVLSPDAHLIIFERDDTGRETSDYAELPPDVLAAIKAQFRVRS